MSVELGALKAMIERHEGRRRKPYRDTQGHLTIGVGRNLAGKGLSDDEIDYLLTNDIEEARAFCYLHVPGYGNLSANRKAVLIDMCFNLGGAGLLKFKRFLEYVAIEDFESAATEMLDSRWAMQVGDRALELADLTRRG